MTPEPGPDANASPEGVRHRGPAGLDSGPAGSGLLEPGFLARLEKLRIVSKRLTASTSAGERRSSAKGASIEFADHRDYQFGDDPRYLDWNAYARLERLFVKLFQQESDIAVHVILDASASMREAEKFTLAKKLAAGLAYVTLANFDRAGLLTLGGAEPVVRMPARGKGNVMRLLELLEGLKADGAPDPAAAIKCYAALQRRAGVAIVISDFLDPRFPEAVDALLHHRHEVWCLHILSPEDRGENLGGDLELVDSESGRSREVSLTPDVLAAYRRTVETFTADFGSWCLKRGVSSQYMDSRSPFEDILMTVLRRRRLVAR